MTPSFCPGCGAKQEAAANFCANCGRRFNGGARRPFQTKNALAILLLSSVLFAFAWTTQATLAGKKPEKHFEASENRSEGFEKDPELGGLAKLAAERSEDLEVQKQYASALIGRIRESESVPAALVFETINVLRNILNINPKEKEALIAMADISFDQQAFTKAIEFYEKYLAEEGADFNARARYASALTFTGRYEKSIEELSRVLKEKPDSFQATAYLAVTYAQMENMKKAQEAGQKALALAPNEEARQRMAAFLGNLNGTKPPATNAPATESDAGENPIVEFIKGNQVAGPKFQNYTVERGGILVLLFNDFPMDKMPPFVRDKFLSSVNEAAQSMGGEKPKTVVFRDIQTGNELSRLNIQ